VADALIAKFVVHAEGATLSRRWFCRTGVWKNPSEIESRHINKTGHIC
jgi:hypothetical protein